MKKPDMSDKPLRNLVNVRESGFGPFGQYINIGHHVIGADEPGAMGGRDTGPDPFELIMAGLGACTTMTIRMVANHKKFPLEDVRVEVRQTAAATSGTPHQFERIVTLTGPLSDEQRRILIEMADKCPVHKMLESGAEISTQASDAAAA